MYYYLLTPERRQTTKKREKEHANRGYDKQCQQGVLCFKVHFPSLTHHGLSPAFICSLCLQCFFPFVLHIHMASARYRAQVKHLLAK